MPIQNGGYIIQTNICINGTFCVHINKFLSNGNQRVRYACFSLFIHTYQSILHIRIQSSQRVHTKHYSYMCPYRTHTHHSDISENNKTKTKSHTERRKIRKNTVTDKIYSRNV